MFVLPTFGLGIVASPTELPIFNVTTRNTEANILASTPSLSAGEAGIAFGTDTYDFYIYDGTAWYIYNNDS
jgi:hypothetical protein